MQGQAVAVVGPLRRLAHLVRRFFQVALARPLTSTEIAEAAAVLDATGLRLFRMQDHSDQRHAHTVMRRVAAAIPDSDAAAAALLHDVGKAGLGMGAVSRAVATLSIALRLPLTVRIERYRHHGEIGAERLTAAGAVPLVVDFARRHPDPEPGGNDPAIWSVLLAADHT